MTTWDQASENERYQSPCHHVINPYLENSPIGLELRGINGCTIQGGRGTHASGNVFVKCTKYTTSGLYAHNNIIDARGASGKVIIDAGCHSNHVIHDGNNSEYVTVEDSDGRNAIGPLIKTVGDIGPIPEFHDGALSGGNSKTNMGLWGLTAGSGCTFARQRS